MLTRTTCALTFGPSDSVEPYGAETAIALLKTARFQPKDKRQDWSSVKCQWKKLAFTDGPD